jgi:hypothetical protein
MLSSWRDRLRTEKQLLILKIPKYTDRMMNTFSDMPPTKVSDMTHHLTLLLHLTPLWCLCYWIVSTCKIQQSQKYFTSFKEVYRPHFVSLLKNVYDKILPHCRVSNTHVPTFARNLMTVCCTKHLSPTFPSGWTQYLYTKCHIFSNMQDATTDMSQHMAA